MQVLQWLFKVSQDQKSKDHHDVAPTSIINNQSKEPHGEKSKLVNHKRKRAIKKARKPEETGLNCKNFRYITLLLRRPGNSKAYFYNTLNQKRISLHNQRQQQRYIASMKMKKEDLVRGLGIKGHHKTDVNAHNVGNNKVLPITDSNPSSSISSPVASNVDKRQCGMPDQKDKVKGENSNKAKTLSRMKELLRWAAAAKSEQAGKLGRKLHFRNRSATIKSGAAFDHGTNDSPKISFRWEVESCSTTCSAVSAPPCFKYEHSARRPGSWITTDDEFVVLEL